MEDGSPYVEEKAAIPDKITFKGQVVEGEERDGAWMMMFQDNTQQPVAREVENWVSSRLVANWNSTYQEGDNRLDAPITQEEVVWAVRHAKSGKAAGIDGIPTELLKQSGEQIERIVKSFWSVYESEKYRQGN